MQDKGYAATCPYLSHWQVLLYAPPPHFYDAYMLPCSANAFSLSISGLRQHISEMSSLYSYFQAGAQGGGTGETEIAGTIV